MKSKKNLKIKGTQLNEILLATLEKSKKRMSQSVD